MFSESSTGRWAVMQLPCCPSKQGELSENILQNLFNNLTPQTVHYNITLHDSIEPEHHEWTCDHFQHPRDLPPRDLRPQVARHHRGGRGVGQGGHPLLVGGRQVRSKESQVRRQGEGVQCQWIGRGLKYLFRVGSIQDLMDSEIWMAIQLD